MYLEYIEGISKNWPEDLKGRKFKHKAVHHYDNPENPDSSHQIVPGRS